MIKVTDSFHGQQAHETCLASFKLDYWESNIEARQWSSMHNINSSTAEQLNSKLRNLDKHIPSLKQICTGFIFKSGMLDRDTLQGQGGN